MLSFNFFRLIVHNHCSTFAPVHSGLRQGSVLEARLILYLTESSNITIRSKSLHWLPVKERSTYKIACLCYHCHSSTTPSYVTDMMHKKPSHTGNTRSSSYIMPILNRPALSKASLVDRSFSFASSFVWNSIPNDVRCAHHCHHLYLVWRHTSFVQSTKTELSVWSLYIRAFFAFVCWFVDGLS